MPGLRADVWYNGEQPIFQRGFVGDRVSRIIGYATIRQLRVKRGMLLQYDRSVSFFVSIIVATVEGDLRLAFRCDLLTDKHGNMFVSILYLNIMFTLCVI